jgi:hypothetical protein
MKNREDKGDGSPCYYTDSRPPYGCIFVPFVSS